MPPLTWRDTASPDTGGAFYGMKNAGDALSRGFGGIGDALGKFNEFAQGQNAATLMANAVKYTNPADLQKAMADGSIMTGVNPGYLTADALKSTQGQVGTLLKNAADTETNKFNVLADPSRLNVLKDNDKVLAGTQAARIASPALANAATIAQTGLTGANTRVADANAGSIISSTLTTDQTRKQGATLFDRGTSAYDAQQQALPLINKLGTTNIGPDVVQNLMVSPEFTSLSPQAQAQVLAHVNSVNAGGGGVTGPSGKAAGAIAGAAGAPTAPANPFAPIADTPKNPYDVAFGNHPTPKPLTQQSMGDVLDYGRNVMIPKIGHSPTGAFQITSDTLEDFGPRVFGSDWRKVAYTPENQDKLGKAIFEDSKNGNLKARWESLPDATPGAYANKTWEQMRPIIMQGEVGSGGSGSGSATPPVSAANEELYKLQQEATANASRASRASEQIEAALAQQTANNINLKYADTQKDNRDVGDIANEMVRAGDAKTPPGAFAGLPVGRLINEINRVKEQSPGMKAATAAAIIAANPKGADLWDRTVPSLFGGHTGPIPNAESNDAMAKAYNDANTFAGSQQAQVMQATQSVIAQRQQAHTQALIDLATALRTSSVTPEQRQAYREKAAITRAELNQVIDRAEKDPSMNFKANKQAPGSQGSPGVVSKALDAATALLPTRTHGSAAAAPVSAPVPPVASITPASPVVAEPSAASAIASAVSSPAPVKAASEKEVTAARSKAQWALDQLLSARDRGDPRVAAYEKINNRASRALQNALGD